MSLTVNNPLRIAAIAGRQIREKSAELADSAQKLSSGNRLGNISGNAGTRAIAVRTASQIAALDAITEPLKLADQAVRLIDATGRGIQDIVIRLKSLALSASSEILSDAERALLDAEYQTLVAEIDRAANDVELNGIKVTATGPAPQLIESTFDDPTTLPTDLILRDAATITGGTLQLTPALNGQRGALIGDTAFVSRGGWETRFTYTTGGGTATGADGLTIFFVDGDQFDGATTALGNAGGGLLYRNIPFGVFGIGLDEFGNFTNPGDGWADGIGFQPDTVGVRAGATSAVPYTLLAQQNVSGFGGIEGTRTVEIAVDRDFQLSVKIDFGSGFVPVVSAQLDPTLVPDTLKFGFGASTGGLNNIHAVEEVEIIAQADPVGSFPEVGVDVKAGDGILPEDRIRLPLANFTAEGLLLDTTDIRTQAAAERSIRRTSFSIDYLSEGLAVISGQGSAIQSASAGLATAIERYQEAEGLLVATNVAAEITRQALAQITLTGGISVLADAVESIEQQFATILPSG